MKSKSEMWLFALANDFNVNNKMPLWFTKRRETPVVFAFCVLFRKGKVEFQPYC